MRFLPILQTIKGGNLMMKLKKILRPALFTVVGMLAGFGYYNLFSCADGSCAITSSPIRTMLYMGVIGLLLSGIFGGKGEETCHT